MLTSDAGTATQSVTIEAGVTASLNVPIVAREVSPQSGWISVASPVDVQLFEGGRLLGSSQTDRIMVPSGTHQLELVNETLGYRTTRSVQVAPGKIAAVAVKLPMGSVAINAIPWAEVWIDGNRIGETPIGNQPATIGNHEIVFRNPELGEKTQTVTVTLHDARAVERRHEEEMIFNARRACVGTLLLAAIVVWPEVLFAEDSLNAARDLYAAAAYEDALAALDRLRAGGVAKVDDNRAVDQYRAFCLLALGKSNEAAQAIEAVVSADPSYYPSQQRRLAARARGLQRRAPAPASRSGAAEIRAGQGVVRSQGLPRRRGGLRPAAGPVCGPRPGAGCRQAAAHGPADARARVPRSQRAGHDAAARSGAAGPGPGRRGCRARAAARSGTSAHLRVVGHQRAGARGDPSGAAAVRRHPLQGRCSGSSRS